MENDEILKRTISASPNPGGVIVLESQEERHKIRGSLEILKSHHLKMENSELHSEENEGFQNYPQTT